MSAGPIAVPPDKRIASERERSLRLPRQVYRLRTLGLAVGAFAVAAVFYENRAPWLAWALLIFHVGLWPHLAWLHARRSADPHAAERANLTVDSAFGGVYVALMHFNLLPSVLIAAMKSMDKIGWGPQFLARTTAAMAAGCAVTMIFTRAAFRPHTSMSVVVASLPPVVSTPLVVSSSVLPSSVVSVTLASVCPELPVSPSVAPVPPSPAESPPQPTARFRAQAANQSPRESISRKMARTRSPGKRVRAPVDFVSPS